MNRLHILSKDRTARRLFLAFVFATAVYLCYCFPFTGDDFGASHIKYSSMQELINFSLSFGNGRFLGNIGVVLLVRFTLLRILFKALCIFGIIFFTSKLLNIKSLAGYSVVTLLVFGVTSSIFAQVFTWTAGFQNYIPPILLTLICLNIIKYIQNISAEKPLAIKIFLCAVLFFLGFSSQLFAENNTVFNCLLAVFLVFFIKKQIHKINTASVVYAISSVLGAAVMFCIPYFGGVYDKLNAYRGANTNSFFSFFYDGAGNFNAITNTFIQNYFLFFLISIACLILLKRSPSTITTKFSKLFTAIFIFVPFYSLIRAIYVGQWVIPHYIIKIIFDFVLLLAYFAIVTITVAALPKSIHKTRIMFCWCCGFAAILPLLVVSPIGPRLLILPYMCFAIFVLYLLKHLNSHLPDKNTNHSIHRLIRSSTVLASAALLFILSLSFTNIHYLDNKRNAYIEEQMETHASTIAYPLLPANGLVYNDGTVFESLEFAYYYETPGDITFDIMSYSQWLDKVNQQQK